MRDMRSVLGHCLPVLQEAQDRAQANGIPAGDWALTCLYAALQQMLRAGSGRDAITASVASLLDIAESALADARGTH